MIIRVHSILNDVDCVVTEKFKSIIANLMHDWRLYVAHKTTYYSVSLGKQPCRKIIEIIHVILQREFL